MAAGEEEEISSALSEKQQKLIAGAQKIDEDCDDALHRAVWLNDESLVRYLLTLEKYRSSLNSRDPRGNTPLHIAAHFANKPLIRLLLHHSAHPTMKNGGGWLPLHESLASGAYQSSLLLFNASQKRWAQEFQKRCTKVAEEIESLPDMYLELGWSFQSWVPLVSRFCPHDTYKIWKRGSCVRIDSTLAGFENMTWNRGQITFLFTGKESSRPNELVIINHDKKTMQWACDAMSKSDFEKEVQMMITADIRKSRLKSETISFSPCKTWFGNPKSEKVGGTWDSKVYETGHVVLKTTTRSDPSAVEKKERRKNKIVEKEKYLEFEEYFELKELMEGMVWSTEKVGKKNREFKGQVWLSKEFPLEVKDFLPIVALLVPSSKYFAKLEEFFQLKLPDEGFPVKVHIPVFPTVSGTASFGVFKEWSSGLGSEDLFDVPNYTVEQNPTSAHK